jgi:hypothetical protein
MVDDFRNGTPVQLFVQVRPSQRHQQNQLYSPLQQRHSGVRGQSTVVQRAEVHLSRPR